MRHKRIHLRDTGDTKPHFGINPQHTGWSDGFNIDFGWWFLAIRNKKSGTKNGKFFELGYGIHERRMRRMRKSDAFRLGRQEAAANILESWISEEGYVVPITLILPRYDLVYEYGRVHQLRINVKKGY